MYIYNQLDLSCYTGFIAKQREWPFPLPLPFPKNTNLLLQFAVSCSFFTLSLIIWFRL